jgi:putative transposase
MQCIRCGSAAVSERIERTTQGYCRFRCRVCSKQFNERSGGVLNRTQYPSDVIALVVLWRLRYKLALRDRPEMFLIRGIVFSHEAVREREAKLTPALAEPLRRRRRGKAGCSWGKAGCSWYVDGTYLKVNRRWCYLYRAIDRSGVLVDVMFGEHRDMAAAKAFFRSAKTVTGLTPDRITTDGHDSYPRAIQTTLGREVRHRTNRHLNNRLEQDQRGIKGRYRPMQGSSVHARLANSVEAMTNYVTSSASGPAKTSLLPLPAAEFTSFDALRQFCTCCEPPNYMASPIKRAALLAGARADRTGLTTTRTELNQAAKLSSRWGPSQWRRTSARSRSTR